MMFKFLIAAGAMCTLMQGCQTMPEKPKVDEAGVALDLMLSQSDALPDRTKSADRVANGAILKGAITINAYAGEAKPLLKKIALAQGLRFSVSGPQPYIPLFVMVDLKDATLIEALTDIGAQFGQRADLVLANNSIEVRYRDK